MTDQEVEFLDLPLELIQKISYHLDDKTKIVLFSLCRYLYYANVIILMNDFYAPSDFIRMNAKFIFQKIKEVKSLHFLSDTGIVINTLSRLSLLSTPHEHRKTTNPKGTKGSKGNITHIIFDNDFNESVDDLQHGVTHLTFEWSFNQSVNNLPASVTHLTFGRHFDQAVNRLPKTLTHLTFHKNFNKSEHNMFGTIITGESVIRV